MFSSCSSLPLVLFLAPSLIEFSVEACYIVIDWKQLCHMWNRWTVTWKPISNEKFLESEIAACCNQSSYASKNTYQIMLLLLSQIAIGFYTGHGRARKVLYHWIFFVSLCTAVKLCHSWIKYYFPWTPNAWVHHCADMGQSEGENWNCWTKQTK